MIVVTVMFIVIISNNINNYNQCSQSEQEIHYINSHIRNYRHWEHKHALSEWEIFIFICKQRFFQLNLFTAAACAHRFGWGKTLNTDIASHRLSCLTSDFFLSSPVIRTWQLRWLEWTWNKLIVHQFSTRELKGPSLTQHCHLTL